ncbi:hypothetical protein [Haliangium sp. UPWRP_2]|uniref:hypothetical protein n=1 Tax=Haliangium sp. UPWRP_2 TaxID=1931276 RepID=UPI000B543AB9|nr:hypothetical protein [Haliangium sp. UPWRP_2]PSM31709.1 hypothetical protein BVG81_003965 [Haliangium sp. UPWRP_2]
MKLKAKDLREAADAHAKRMESPLWQPSAGASDWIGSLADSREPSRKTLDQTDQPSQRAVGSQQAARLVRQLNRALELRDSVGMEMQSEQGQHLLKALEYELRIAMQILKPRDQQNSERLGRIASGS